MSRRPLEGGQLRKALKARLEKREIDLATFRGTPQTPAELARMAEVSGIPHKAVAEAVAEEDRRPGSFTGRKLPRQVDTAKGDWTGMLGLGRNIRGGTRPRLSCGRSWL